MEEKTIIHPLAPCFDSRSRVLILGTMPSPKSREQGFYYMHPQNRFWRVMAELFHEAIPSGIEERKDFALRHQIALWDVLYSCKITGASDASIADPVPNDLRAVLDAAQITAVFTTGKKAYDLYRRLCEDSLGRKATLLPSTSPANCRVPLDELIKKYLVVLNILNSQRCL